MDRSTYSAVSLFSGGMGLDIGLESTKRFSVRACVEKQSAFCQTISANQKAGRLSPKLAIFSNAIEVLDPNTILDRIGLKPGELDLLVGGPPCQSFSTTGRRATVQDPRGTLLWQFLRFVEAMQPKFFLMENVRGLISAALRHRPISQRPDKGGPPLEPDEMPGSVVRAFADDLQKISGTHFHMDCFEVNAVNYGAPQLRERAFFIGNRYGARVDFPDPTHGPALETNQQLCLPGLCESLLPWRTLGDAIANIHEADPEVMDFSPRKKGFLSLIPEGSNWRSLPIELQQKSMGTAWHAKGGRSGWWRRLTFDLPCPTLLTMPNHAGTALCHPIETRALTLKEYAAIQEFPPDWVFCGTTAEKYAQVGNAVPVRLGQVAGEVIASELDRLQHQNWQSEQKDAIGYRIVYVQSHVRTRKWYKDGEALRWHQGSPEKPAYAAPKTRRKSKAIEENS